MIEPQFVFWTKTTLRSIARPLTLAPCRQRREWNVPHSSRLGVDSHRLHRDAVAWPGTAPAISPTPSIRGGTEPLTLFSIAENDDAAPRLVESRGPFSR